MQTMDVRHFGRTSGKAASGKVEVHPRYSGKKFACRNMSNRPAETKAASSLSRPFRRNPWHANFEAKEILQSPAMPRRYRACYKTPAPADGHFVILSSILGVVSYAVMSGKAHLCTGTRECKPWMYDISGEPPAKPREAR